MNHALQACTPATLLKLGRRFAIAKNEWSLPGSRAREALTREDNVPNGSLPDLGGGVADCRPAPRRRIPWWRASCRETATSRPSTSSRWSWSVLGALESSRCARAAHPGLAPADRREDECSERALVDALETATRIGCWTDRREACGRLSSDTLQLPYDDLRLSPPRSRAFARDGRRIPPGLRLHPLKGDRAGHWAVRVSANWRVVFRFDGRDVRNEDLTDYHWEIREHADEEPAAFGPLRAP